MHSTNFVFWLGVLTPLLLVCVVFLVVGVAGKKQDQPVMGAVDRARPQSPVDSGPARTSK